VKTRKAPMCLVRSRRRSLVELACYDAEEDSGVVGGNPCGGEGVVHEQIAKTSIVYTRGKFCRSEKETYVPEGKRREKQTDQV